ncbi:MAG: CRISPR system precrRNA processing endoribonuclease RAMP protein Cas6 [Caldilineaceae bacterium]
MSITNLPENSALRTPQLIIPLTAHHIRFTVRAVTPIVFGEFKGSALRGALAGVLRRTFCPEWRAEQTDPLHQALCPICQLLTWEGDEETSGDVRRPYALEPPLDAQNEFRPGETFHFGFTLYGDKLAYLPYLILGVGGVGETGVGQRVARGREQGARGREQGAGSKELGDRGRFTVERIDAVNPLSGAMQVMMAPGEKLVNSATLPVTHDQIMNECERRLGQLAAQDNHLTIHFRTPTRVTQDEHTTKRAEFFPFCKKVVLRVLDLAAQHGGGRPLISDQPLEMRRDIYPYADQVQLVQDQTHWWDLKGYSSRLERAQMLGGFVGQATYRAEDWRLLLPWLLWGMSTHVGKNIVKGCGIYEIAGGG